MTVCVELGQGQYAFVDDADAGLVGQHRWYAMRRQTTTRGRSYEYGWVAATRAFGPVTYLHCIIAQPDAGQVVDHINGDTLDNRRSNLRVCSHLQNRCNSSISRANKSGFSGVSFHARKQKWKADLQASGRSHFIGWFNTAEEAAQKWDAAAREWRGQYARLNFPLKVCPESAKAKDRS